MHHVSIYFHDERLSGNTPRCNLTIMTNASHNLGSRVQELADAIDKRFPGVNTRFKTLHIACHGGSSGLQLASGANQWNVRLFQALRQKVGRIEVHGCTAARDHTQATPWGPYNGQQFGRWLAMVTQATVLAADTDQLYYDSNQISNFSNNNQNLRWQGTVTRWHPDGRTIHTSQEDREAGIQP